MGEGCLAIFGVLFPPLATMMTHGSGIDLLINLLFYIFTVWIGGIVHFFYINGVSLCTAIFNTILPPLGVFLSCGCSIEFLVSCILTCTVVPGIVYAHYVSLIQVKMKKLKQPQHNIVINVNNY